LYDDMASQSSDESRTVDRQRVPRRSVSVTIPNPLHLHPPPPPHRLTPRRRRRRGLDGISPAPNLSLFSSSSSTSNYIKMEVANRRRTAAYDPRQELPFDVSSNTPEWRTLIRDLPGIHQLLTEPLEMLKDDESIQDLVKAIDDILHEPARVVVGVIGSVGSGSSTTINSPLQVARLPQLVVEAGAPQSFHRNSVAGSGTRSNRFSPMSSSILDMIG
ncbi:hypothetical protein TI39_contig4419g00001, partial [Zymoseptoria brevis]